MNIELTDDGTGGDTVASDGTYTTEFVYSAINGQYAVDLYADGTYGVGCQKSNDGYAASRW